MAENKIEFTAEEFIANLVKGMQPPSKEDIDKMNDKLVNNIIADIFPNVDKNQSDKSSIIVQSQEDVNNIPKDYKGSIFVNFGDRENPAIFKDLDGASIVLEDCVAEVFGKTHVYALDNVAVTAYDEVKIESCENAYITAHDNVSATIGFAEHIDAYDNVEINAIIVDENAHVNIFAHDDCLVAIHGYQDCVQINAEPTVSIMKSETPCLGSQLLENESVFSVSDVEVVSQQFEKTAPLLDNSER